MDNIIRTCDGKEVRFTDKQIKKFPKYKKNMIIPMSYNLFLQFYNYITYNKFIDDKYLTSKYIKIIYNYLGLDLFEDMLSNNINKLYSIKELNVIFNTSFNENIKLSMLQYIASYSKYIKNSHYLINKFIKAGADINLQNKYGYTALMYCASNSNNTSTEKTVELLIKLGANVNLQDNIGCSALMLASKYSNYTSSIKTIKILINGGANVYIRSKDNLDAYDLYPNKKFVILKNSIDYLLLRGNR